MARASFYRSLSHVSLLSAYLVAFISPEFYFNLLMRKLTELLGGVTGNSADTAFLIKSPTILI